MPKNFFEDMVRIKKEQRQNALNNNSSTSSMDSVRREESTSYVKPESVHNEAHTEDSSYEAAKPHIETKFASIYDVAETPKKSSKKSSIWVVAIVSILFLLFALSYLFAGAEITISPKVQTVTLNQNLNAVKDATGETLGYDTVVLSGEETVSLQGGEERDVANRAKGKVIIYNDYSSAAQRLDIDTRLEGSNGKLYKTETKTTVPGKSKDGKPGAVEVNIYAAEPGEEFNSEPVDFKIFGFKGTAKYAKFYARSKGDITGGFKGRTRAVSDEEKTKAVNELKTALETKLFNQAMEQLPEGFVMFPGGSLLHVDSQTTEDAKDASDNSVTLKLKGTFYGFLFEENKLTKSIATKAVGGYDGAPVHMPKINDATFALANGEENTVEAYTEAKDIDFNISGTSNIVWDVDTEKLLADITGKDKKELNQILEGYPNITSAEVSVRPFWKMSFPDHQEDITLNVLSGE